MPADGEYSAQFLARSGRERALAGVDGLLRSEGCQRHLTGSLHPDQSKHPVDDPQVENLVDRNVQPHKAAAEVAWLRVWVVTAIV